MGAVSQYGTSPVVAQFQGFISTTDPAAVNNLVTRAVQGCAAKRTGTGIIVLSLNTSDVVLAGESVDHFNYLAQVMQYGPQLNVAILYATPDTNDITFTFGTPFNTDPGTDDLFDIVVYQCSDGIINTGLIADL
jgi:hypothetical protein